MYMLLESERQIWHVSLDMCFTPNPCNPKTGIFAYIFFSLHSRTPPTHKADCFASGSLWVSKARIRMFNKV